ncbi:MAG TPA: TetR/AcrR family transcriptional regulator [Mycobacterium sp.]|nr:TetR/AcrR family transcriptional regulator [Mycobacterium sp.]HQC78872.1 TetR/AcrR family transcriptional regulator [Mycobacterium sp.]
MTGPRERMVVSAALLMRERGARSTAIADVLEHSGAPRGSAYHYFPGGRGQLLCEAVDYAAGYVADAIGGAPSAAAMLDAAVRFYRKSLLDSDFRAGCPVMAVAVEAGDPDPRTAAAVQHAAAAFDLWSDLIAQRLIADGVSRGKAADLATLVIAALEGALVLARTQRDVAPLDATHRRLRSLLKTEGK